VFFRYEKRVLKRRFQSVDAVAGTLRAVGIAPSAGVERQGHLYFQAQPVHGGPLVLHQQSVAVVGQVIGEAYPYVPFLFAFAGSQVAD
jgi:hypothetical protein